MYITEGNIFRHRIKASDYNKSHASYPLNLASCLWSNTTFHFILYITFYAFYQMHLITCILLYEANSIYLFMCILFLINILPIIEVCC